MKISKNGLDVIKKYESLKLKAYLCPANILTIGYGHTGKDVTPNMSITESKADSLLESDVVFAENAVNKHVTVDITQNQFDALVCFVFNVGADAFKNSTLLKLLNQKLYKEASEQFIRWNKSSGKVLNGLTKRRKEESELFLK